jgi:hypothetical protein
VALLPYIFIGKEQQGRGSVMSKKTAKTTKRQSPRPAVKQEDTAYLVREDLDPQEESLEPATPKGTSGSKAPAPTPTATEPANPLTPVAAVWPGTDLPPAEGPKPAQAPAGKGESPSVPATVPKAVPPTPKPPLQPGQSKSTAAAPQTVNVNFVLFEPKAKQVSLCGDFTRWASDAIPMKRRGDGHWETTVALAPGKHEYKFIVDGQWLPDPLAREQVWNRHGSLNSVVEARG